MTTIQSILSRLTNAVGGTDKDLYKEQELNEFAEFYLDNGMRIQARRSLQSLLPTSGGIQTRLAEDALYVAS